MSLKIIFPVLTLCLRVKTVLLMFGEISIVCCSVAKFCHS